MSSRPSAGRILPRYHLGKTDKGSTPLTPLRRAAAPGGVARQPALANHRGVGSVSRGSPLAQLSDTKGHAKAGSPATPQSRVGSVSAAVSVACSLTAGGNFFNPTPQSFHAATCMIRRIATMCGVLAAPVPRDVAPRIYRMVTFAPCMLTLFWPTLVSFR